MRQITLSTFEYPTQRKALLRLQEELTKINDGAALCARQKPTMGMVIDRFFAEERIEEIVTQAAGDVVITDGLAYSTAVSYRSNMNKHLRSRWGSIALVDVKPLDVAEWIIALPLAPKPRDTSGASCTCSLKRRCFGTSSALKEILSS